jgi:anti-anti-sigma regulatory factor
MSDKTISLPSELTIVKISQIKATLMPLIDNCDAITIDDQSVVRIDTIGVQFLVAFIHYIISQRKKITWQNPSKLIKRSFKQLGITDPVITDLLELSV